VLLYLDSRLAVPAVEDSEGFWFYTRGFDGEYSHLGIRDLSSRALEAAGVMGTPPCWMTSLFLLRIYATVSVLIRPMSPILLGRPHSKPLKSRPPAAHHERRPT